MTLHQTTVSKFDNLKGIVRRRQCPFLLKRKMNYFINILYTFSFYAMFFIPSFSAIIWFIVSLIKYKRTDNSSPKLRIRQKLTIVSGCAAGSLFLATALLMGLFFFALRHM